MVNYIPQELYGGAISVKLPEGLLDASQFRQVPDTQEVFLNPSTNTTDYNNIIKDDSIIIDLMESQETQDPVEALKEHFTEISTLNDTESSWKLLSTEIDLANMLDSNFAVVGVGMEPALKWGRKEQVSGQSNSDFRPTLVIVLGLIRLQNVETDVLITYNVLINTPEELEALNELDKGGYSESENKAYVRIRFAIDVVKTAINNFKVESWELFG